MFFTYASRVLSILFLLVGASLIFMGFVIINGSTGLPYDEAVARYLRLLKALGKQLTMVASMS